MNVTINADCPIVIELQTLDDWGKFASDNAADLEAAYGSIANAYKHAIDGGLMLGETLIHFAP